MRTTKRENRSLEDSQVCITEDSGGKRDSREFTKWKAATLWKIVKAE